MKAFITGGTGLLGSNLIETGGPDCDIVATYFGDYHIEDSDYVKYRNLDLRDKKGYEDLFDIFRPDVVIHTAGINSPDLAEKNKELAWRIDVQGTKDIILLCQKFSARLIYISSNGIYDGENAPYAEQDLARPVNYYGRIKLECEELVNKAGAPVSIVRPILMYGWNHPMERQNIVALSIKKMIKGEIAYLYEDIFCNPISAEFCAGAIWKIARNNIYDVFNIGGRDIVSIYELVRIAAGIFGLDSALLKPVRQGFFRELIKRPANTSFNTAKMEKILGMPPLALRKGLELMREARKTYA